MSGRTRTAAAFALLALCAPVAAAIPPSPIPPRPDPPPVEPVWDIVREYVEPTAEPMMKKVLVSISRCRQTLLAAQQDVPHPEDVAYQVQVPFLDVVPVDETSVDGTVYYEETDSVAAAVPDYCPTEVRTVLRIVDASPGLETYEVPPRADTGDSRASHTPLSLRVPYFGMRGDRVVSFVTVRAEAWNGPIGNYFCREYQYKVVATPTGPALLRQDEVAACVATE